KREPSERRVVLVELTREGQKVYWELERSIWEQFEALVGLLDAVHRGRLLGTVHGTVATRGPRTVALRFPLLLTTLRALRHVPQAASSVSRHLVTHIELESSCETLCGLCRGGGRHRRTEVSG